MSNQSREGGSDDNQLFKNTDAQERIYAPEQVPSAQLSETEADRASTAGVSGARASYDATADDRRAALAGADEYHPPIVPALASYSGGGNMPVVPIVAPDDNDAAEGADRR